MELQKVTLIHPDPAVADAEVPASSVDHWRGQGWLTQEEYDAQQDAAQRLAEHEQQKKVTARRRGSEEKD